MLITLDRPNAAENGKLENAQKLKQLNRSKTSHSNTSHIILLAR